MTRIVVLSDLHLAPPGRLATFHATGELADMLARELRDGTTLVLAGDTFDLLQVEQHPGVIDLLGAASRVRTCLDGFASTTGGRAVLNALRTALQNGTRCVVIPGNHDPETRHPEVELVLRQALGLDSDDPRLTVHRRGVPWNHRVGDWDVLVGHGNRRDPFNDIDVDEIRSAIDGGAESYPLPPGSRLVVDGLNAYKLAHSATDPRHFHFIDAFKPEVPAVPLLMLYLDPELACSKVLPTLGMEGSRALVRALRGRLRKGGTLRAHTEGNGASGAVTDCLAGALTDSERLAPDATVRALEDALENVRRDRTPAASGMLAHGNAGGGFRPLLRAAVYALSSDGAHFRTDEVGAGVDAPIISEHLPPGCPRRVVVAGHTHAAREIHVDGDSERVYLNTGTWSDLLRLPTDLPALTPELLADSGAIEALDVRLEGWINDVVAGRIAPLRRLSFAEVGEDGPRLRWWRPDPATLT